VPGWICSGVDAQNASPAVRAELETYLRERPNDPGALARLATASERGRRGPGDRHLREAPRG
jgi:hypothetical protein